MDVLIRKMALDDLPAGLALCRASGWNQTAADWRTFLTDAPHGAIVAMDAARIIGSAATLPYGPFTWVSMVLVDPAARGRGVGTLLLERVLSLVPTGSVARLDATPLGEPLYRKLGFTPEYGLARWFLDRPDATPGTGPGTGPGVGTRAVEEGDWPAIRAIDAEVFGASRATLLARLAAEASDFARVCVEREGVRGYVLGRRGHVRDHIGPLVADSVHTATRLLDACLTASTDRGVIVDAPDAQTAWRDVLIARGFSIERPFLRMSRGPLAAPGDPSRVFAVTGPEFG
jgi:GNAT superfamily N-acetyltransferase